MPGDAHHRRELWVAAVGKANDFSVYAILLCGEGQRSDCGTKKGGVRGGVEVESDGTMEQLDFIEAKGCGFRAGAGVFARAQEEEKGNGDHVGDCDVEGWATLKSGGENMLQDGDRDGFDTVGRWILLGMARQLSLDAEVNFAKGV